MLQIGRIRELGIHPLPENLAIIPAGNESYSERHLQALIPRFNWNSDFSLRLATLESKVFILDYNSQIPNTGNIFIFHDIPLLDFSSFCFQPLLLGSLVPRASFQSEMLFSVSSATSRNFTKVIFSSQNICWFEFW